MATRKTMNEEVQRVVDVFKRWTRVITAAIDDVILTGTIVGSQIGRQLFEVVAIFKGTFF